MSRFGDFVTGVVDSLQGEDPEAEESTLPPGPIDPQNLVHNITSGPYINPTVTLPNPEVFSQYAPQLEVSINERDQNWTPQQSEAAEVVYQDRYTDPNGIGGYIRAMSPGQIIEDFRDDPLNKDIDIAKVDEIIATATPFSPEWDMAMQVKQEIGYDFAQAMQGEDFNRLKPSEMTLSDQLRALNANNSRENQFYDGVEQQKSKIPTIFDQPSVSSQYSPQEIAKLRDQYAAEAASYGDQIAAIDAKIAASDGMVTGELQGAAGLEYMKEHGVKPAVLDPGSIDALMGQRQVLIDQYNQAVGAAIYLGLDPAELEEQAVEGSAFYSYLLRWWDAPMNHQKEQAGQDLVGYMTGKDQDSSESVGQKTVNEIQTFLAENIGFRTFYDRYKEVLDQAAEDDRMGREHTEAQKWRDGAKASYEQGYNGFTGYRAVWEYGVGTLFTPADRMSMEIVGDPFNMASVLGGAAALPIKLGTKAGNPKVAKALWALGKTMEAPEQAEVFGAGYAVDAYRGWKTGQGVTRVAAATGAKGQADTVRGQVTGWWKKATDVTPETSAQNAAGETIDAALDENYAQSSAMLANSEIIASVGEDNARTQTTFRWRWDAVQNPKEDQTLVPINPKPSGHSAANVNYQMFDETNQPIDPASVTSLYDPSVNMIRTRDAIAVRTEVGAETWQIIPTKYWNDYTKGNFDPVEIYTHAEMGAALDIDRPMIVTTGSTAHKIAVGDTDGLDVTYLRTDGTAGKVDDGTFEVDAGTTHSIEIGLVDTATGEMMTAVISPVWVDPRRISQTRKVNPANSKRWTLVIYGDNGAIADRWQAWSYEKVMKKLDEVLESGKEIAPEQIAAAPAPAAATAANAAAAVTPAPQTISPPNASLNPTSHGSSSTTPPSTSPPVSSSSTSTTPSTSQSPTTPTTPTTSHTTRIVPQTPTTQGPPPGVRTPPGTPPTTNQTDEVVDEVVDETEEVLDEFGQRIRPATQTTQGPTPGRARGPMSLEDEVAALLEQRGFEAADAEELRQVAMKLGVSTEDLEDTIDRLTSGTRFQTNRPTPPSTQYKPMRERIEVTTSSGSYSQRTNESIRDSDVVTTIMDNYGGSGTAMTISNAQKAGKYVQLNSLAQRITELADETTGQIRIMIGGPGLSSLRKKGSALSQVEVDKLVSDDLTRQLNLLPDEVLDRLIIVTGGQTGVDEAVHKALNDGRLQAVQGRAHMPKNGRRRLADGTDVDIKPDDYHSILDGSYVQSTKTGTGSRTIIFRRPAGGRDEATLPLAKYIQQFVPNPFPVGKRGVEAAVDDYTRWLNGEMGPDEIQEWIDTWRGVKAGTVKMAQASKSAANRMIELLENTDRYREWLGKEEIQKYFNEVDEAGGFQYGGGAAAGTRNHLDAFRDHLKSLAKPTEPERPPRRTTPDNNVDDILTEALNYNVADATPEMMDMGAMAAGWKKSDDGSVWSSPDNLGRARVVAAADGSPMLELWIRNNEDQMVYAGVYENFGQVKLEQMRITGHFVDAGSLGAKQAVMTFFYTAAQKLDNVLGSRGTAVLADKIVAYKAQVLVKGNNGGIVIAHTANTQQAERLAESIRRNLLEGNWSGIGSAFSDPRLGRGEIKADLKSLRSVPDDYYVLGVVEMDRHSSAAILISGKGEIDVLPMARGQSGAVIERAIARENRGIYDQRVLALRKAQRQGGVIPRVYKALAFSSTQSLLTGFVKTADFYRDPKLGKRLRELIIEFQRDSDWLLTAGGSLDPAGLERIKRSPYINQNVIEGMENKTAASMETWGAAVRYAHVRDTSAKAWAYLFLAGPQYAADADLAFRNMKEMRELLAQHAITDFYPVNYFKLVEAMDDGNTAALNRMAKQLLRKKPGAVHDVVDRLIEGDELMRHLFDRVDVSSILRSEFAKGNIAIRRFLAARDAREALEAGLDWSQVERSLLATTRQLGDDAAPWAIAIQDMMSIGNLYTRQKRLGELSQNLFYDLVDKVRGILPDDYLKDDFADLVNDTDALPLPGEVWEIGGESVYVYAARMINDPDNKKMGKMFQAIVRGADGQMRLIPVNADLVISGAIKTSDAYKARLITSTYRSGEQLIQAFSSAKVIEAAALAASKFEPILFHKNGWVTFSVTDDLLPDIGELGRVKIRVRPNNKNALTQLVQIRGKSKKVGYAGNERRIAGRLKEGTETVQWPVYERVVDPQNGITARKLTPAEMEEFEILEVQLLGSESGYKGGMMAQVLVPKGTDPGTAYKQLLESWVENGTLDTNTKAILPRLQTNGMPQRISLLPVDKYDSTPPLLVRPENPTQDILDGRAAATAAEANRRATQISGEISAVVDEVEQIVEETTGFGRMRRPKTNRQRNVTAVRATEYGDATVRSDVERFGKRLYEILAGESWDDAQNLHFSPGFRRARANTSGPPAPLPYVKNEEYMRQAHTLLGVMNDVVGGRVLDESQLRMEIHQNWARPKVKIQLPFDTQQQQTLWNTRLNGNTGYGRMTRGEVLEKMLKKEYGDDISIKNATPQMLASLGGKLEATFRTDMGVQPTEGFVKWWDGAVRFTQENMLVGGLGAMKYLVGNQLIGTTTQAAWGKQATFMHMGNPFKHFRAIDRQVKKGQLAIHSPAFAFADEIGAVVTPDIVGGGAFADTLPSKIQKVTDEPDLVADPNSMMGKVVQEIADAQKGALGWALRTDPDESGFIKAVDKIYSPFRLDGRARAWILSTGHSVEQAQRTAVQMSGLKAAWGEGIGQQRAALKTMIQEQLAAGGIDAVRSEMYATKIIEALGPRFKPDDVRELIYSVGRIEWQAGNINGVQWQDVFGKLSMDAYESQRRFVAGVVSESDRRMQQVMFNWDQRNIDKWMGRVIPFWRYYSRALPYYLSAMARNPELAYGYHQVVDLLNETSEEKDWPDWMKNYLQVMNGPGGMFIAMNPAAALGLFSFFMPEAEFDGENRGLLGKFYADVQEKTGVGGILGGSSPLNVMPFAIFPMALAGLMGDQNQFLDPFAMWTATKHVVGAVNFAGSRGWLPGDVDPRGRPLESVLANMRERLSGIIPGVEQVEYVNPAVNTTAKIRWLMLDTYLSEHGWDSSDLQAMWGSYLAQSAGEPADNTLAAQFVEMMDVLSEQADMEAGPYWDQAEDRLYTGQLQMVLPIPVPMTNLDSEAEIAEFLGMAAAGTLMGPKIVEPTLLHENRIDRERAQQVGNQQLLQDAAFLQLMQSQGVSKEELQDWMNDRQGLAYFLRDYGYADNRALELIMQDQAYRSIGGAGTDELKATVQQIRNGDLELDSITVGGIVIQKQDLASLPLEDRFLVADLWIAENDPSGSLAKVGVAEDAFSDTHPAYKGYREWQSYQRKTWEDTGGAREYRAAVSAVNPGAKKYYEEQRRKYVKQGYSGDELEDKMRQVTWSMDAYMATYGIEKDGRDPYKGNSQMPEPRGGAPAAAGEKTDTGGPITIRTLAQALQNQQTWNQTLQQMGLPARSSLTPPEQAALDLKLEEMGLTPPPDLWIAEDFQSWQGYQQLQGMPSSMADYLIMLETTGQRPGQWQPMRVESYMPGGWGMTAQSGIDAPMNFQNDVNRNYTANQMGQRMDGGMGPFQSGMGQRVTGGGGSSGMGQRTTSVSMR